VGIVLGGLKIVKKDGWHPSNKLPRTLIGDN